jgi:hypothetical protein
MKGFEAGGETEAVLSSPRDGRIRVDLTAQEILDLQWLASFGWQHTMWNTCNPEGDKERPTDRVFKNDKDAERQSNAIKILEHKLPKDHPIGAWEFSFDRQKDIWNQLNRHPEWNKF